MRRTLFAMTTAILLLGGIARAQDQSLRIGVCNPNRVWEGMEERKKIQEATVAKRDSLKIEAARRQTEVNELKKQRDALKPESAQYREKSKLVAEKEIEFAVWLRVTDMDLAREEKEQIKALFERITEATREVAAAKKIDLVLTERRPELPDNMEQLTPDQVRAALIQRDVLFMNERADITQDVILAANQKFAQKAAGGSGGK